MTPILYEKDEIDFTTQGLGTLSEIYNVDVEEQRNGLLQLTASYPVSGIRYADISVGRIILTKPNHRDDLHAFRIVRTALDISGYTMTIEADSITYDLTHNIVKHLNVSGNGQSFMTALKNSVVNSSIFEFYSDISTSSTTSLHYVNPMQAIMGTTGSFLQIWGGELKRENRRVAMFNRRGRDNVSTFRLGKNISGLKYSVDISSLVTRIIPTKSIQNNDQTTTTLEGTPVDSQYIKNYEQIYTLPLEFTDDTIKTVADLNAAAKNWFTQSANTGRDKPTVTIDIDVLSLQDSADYQDKFKNLESVSLTDTVTVYVPEYGVNVTAIVNELHYDPILNRVTKMTVGTAKQSFADSSRTQLSDLQNKIISVQNQADAAVVSANGKSKNYYGSVKPSHPQEGDQWYWIDGDKSGIKQFFNGDWVDLFDSDTEEKIAAGVEEAVSKSKEQSQILIDNNNTSIRSEMQSVATQKAKDEISKGNFDAKAQKYADDAKNEAIIDAAGKFKNQKSDIDHIAEVVGQQGDNVDTLTSRVTTAEGTVTTVSSDIKGLKTVTTQLSGQISQEISDRKTGDENTLLMSKNYTISTINNSIDGVNSQITQTADLINANLGSNNLLPNTNFTEDWGYESKTGNTGMSPNQNVDGSVVNMMIVKSTESKSQGYRFLPIPVTAGTFYSGSVWVYNFGALKNGAAIFEWLFYDKDGNNVVADIGDSVTQSNTSGWKKLYLENIKAPAKAVTLKVALITNDAGNGQVYTFGKPQVTATSKLQPYTINDGVSSQLSLMRDKFVFGLNSGGQLISGIVGNTQSIVLKGNAITLDGTTNVTGDFYAKGGNFKNINASNINAGTIDGNSINVVNINVANLTGDTTRFIQSSWDGSYGSVKIDQSGMKVTTSKVITEFRENGMLFNQSNELVGGISVDGYSGMASNYQGLNFKLSGKGDYMAWSARDNGVESGDYDTKMAWFRSGSARPKGTQAGFSFSDDVNLYNRLRFLGKAEIGVITSEGESTLSIEQKKFNNFVYQTIGSRDLKMAFGDKYLYYVSQSGFKRIDSMFSLAGLGNIAIPKGFDSDGKATGWFNITT